MQKQVDLIQRLTWDRGQDFILIDKNKTLKEDHENMLHNHNSDLKQKEGVNINNYQYLNSQDENTLLR